VVVEYFADALVEVLLQVARPVVDVLLPLALAVLEVAGKVRLSACPSLTESS
jgi:hypothetical protein